ncbi:hypothetical protein DRN73_06970 [Candidatus Pacearchaeota archaeon]|nr:MAG: hypothetical protein DRN73_06970 [Candidatus Pacearchaeota archaeon]
MLLILFFIFTQSFSEKKFNQMYQLGLEFMREEKYYKAKKVFERLSKLRPYTAEYHWQLARCKVKLGDYYGANNSYLKVIKLIGMRPDVVKEYALMWYKAGEYQKSYLWYDFSFKKAPWDMEIPKKQYLLKLERGISFSFASLPYHSFSTSFYSNLFYGGFEDFDINFSYYRIKSFGYKYQSFDFLLSKRFFFKYEPRIFICRRGLYDEKDTSSFWIIGGDFSIFYIRSLDYFFSFYKIDTNKILKFGLGFRPPKISNIGRFKVYIFLKYKDKICLPVFHIFYLKNDSLGLNIFFDHAKNNDLKIFRTFEIVPWYSILIFKKRFALSLPFGFYEVEKNRKNYWFISFNSKFFVWNYKILSNAGLKYFPDFGKFIFYIDLTLRTGFGFGAKKIKERVDIFR